jgi:hypothetical protein
MKEKTFQDASNTTLNKLGRMHNATIPARSIHYYLHIAICECHLLMLSSINTTK